LGILFAFGVNTFGPVPTAQASEFRLPAPGVMIHLSPEFNPPVLKGIKVHPDNPFRFDFILDTGDSHKKPMSSPNALIGDPQQEQLKNEATKLIKYFLASLTIPEKDLWVNLSPYEKGRIIPSSFGLTEMGRDLLAEDYMLKQITASLIYPEDEIGKKFWKRIYEVAAKKFGTTNIPVNTFNKVWIVPEKAVVYENAKAGAAYVVESKLKVMLEQDYLSLQKHEGIQSKQIRRDAINQNKSVETPLMASLLGSRIVREIVIPELTKEVNKNKNFAQLRQVYNSLILATWYKKKIKDSILEQVYADKKKVAGVSLDDPRETEKIYQRYLRAFKKGVYNYIKEEQDPITQETVPKKYFSGGLDMVLTIPHFGLGDKAALSVIEDASQIPADEFTSGNELQVKATIIDPTTITIGKNSTKADDQAMNMETVNEFNHLFSQQIKDEEESDGFSAANTQELLNSMEIKDVEWIDEESFLNTKVYRAISPHRDRFIVFVDRDNKVVLASVSVERENRFGAVKPSEALEGERYQILSKRFNKIFEDKIRPFLEQHNYSDRRPKAGLERHFLDPPKVFFPLINSFYNTSKLRDDFVNNKIIRHIIRQLIQRLKDPAVIYGYSNYICSIDGYNHASAISADGYTLYDLHTISTMKNFPLHHQEVVAHELGHELFNTLNDDQKRQLFEYFQLRPELIKAVTNSPAYTNNKGDLLVTELISHIISSLVEGFVQVQRQDATLVNIVRDNIRRSDIDILIKFGFLPEEFRPLASQSDESITLSGLAEVYPQAQIRIPGKVQLAGGAADNDAAQLSKKPFIIGSNIVSVMGHTLNKFKTKWDQEVSSDRAMTIDDIKLPLTPELRKEVAEVLIDSGWKKDALNDLFEKSGLGLLSIGEMEMVRQKLLLSMAIENNENSGYFLGTSEDAWKTREKIVKELFNDWMRGIGYDDLDVIIKSFEIPQFREVVLEAIEDHVVKYKLDQKTMSFYLYGLMVCIRAQDLNIEMRNRIIKIIKKYIKTLRSYRFYASAEQYQANFRKVQTEFQFPIPSTGLDVDSHNNLPRVAAGTGISQAAFLPLPSSATDAGAQLTTRRGVRAYLQDFLKRLMLELQDTALGRRLALTFFFPIKTAASHQKIADLKQAPTYVPADAGAKELPNFALTKSPRPEEPLQVGLGGNNPAGQDQAMEASVAKKGGIDFTSANANLQTRNSGGEIKFHMDAAMLAQLQKTPGFVPVIISIQPMVNLRDFLGLSNN